jgi:hypothetical protein
MKIPPYLCILKSKRMKQNQTVAQFLGIKKFPYHIRTEQGKAIYSEGSNGFWKRSEYDANGNQTYHEKSNGIWWKSKYDANGNQTEYENSDSYWTKSEFDTNSKQIYYEDSEGLIKDNRPKQVELTLAEIATKLNIPLGLLRIKE